MSQSVFGDPSAPHAPVQNSPPHVTMRDSPNTANVVNIASSNGSAPQSREEKTSDIQALAASITKSMQTSRLPISTPPVFTANALEFTDWEISFKTLVENTNVQEADKIHYLKQYVGGPA